MRASKLGSLVGILLASTALGGDCDLPKTLLSGTLTPEPGHQSVVLDYFNTDLIITGDGITLTTHTTITVTNGRIIVEGPIHGRPPNSFSRPAGDPGQDANGLLLRTICSAPPDADPHGAPKGAHAARSASCCDVLISSTIDLSGEHGTNGFHVPMGATGSGGPGGSGGDGGRLSIASSGNIIDSGFITTAGGHGGEGGAGGERGDGGQGGQGGAGGDVDFRQNNSTPIDARIEINGTINTSGGSGGHGGSAGVRACGGCGVSSVNGGSGRAGGNGGEVTIIGRFVQLADPLSDVTINTNGGTGGNGRPGQSGIEIACAHTDPSIALIVRALRAQDRDPEDLLELLGSPSGACHPPVNGGNAGNAGPGGNAGDVCVAALHPVTNPTTPSLSGSAEIHARGGAGGHGAAGGVGASLDLDCDGVPECCGEAGISQPGDQGGAGGLIRISALVNDLNVTLNSQGGRGGSGGEGSNDACGPCSGTQGARGGSGGAGGSFTYTGALVPDSLPVLVLNTLGGSGGDGGDSMLGAPSSVGGGVGKDGPIIISTDPFMLVPELTGSKSTGANGDSGLPCP